ncbi:hypothetical protein DSM106972_047640 [Dulcicalothrix desertica PCC 7102]|uniref:Uncharacterized protein n=1 Tax=Dulcicalothrix desertica PCC 7102 TaxID=232991 RepID=A0A433VCL2_9CYAN|nr:hypothetical protein [Dulcicalothrix desertica]RUT03850.1 hypothetical protein DSM106972_047640 [Dulcicalothrix desertica PCC 7102]TWH43739.1 hypothetical protein CAL7102_07483 [Dulcicalothrix desertica PCC 7102]
MSKHKNYRDWTWQITKEGGGPDSFFTATFDPDDAQRLSNKVREYLPSEFVRNQDFYNPNLYKDYSLYESYLDKNAYKMMLSKHNCWIYTQIEVVDHKLYIESGYCVTKPNDTNFIIALATSADLTLCNWKISCGGQGYNHVEIAHGSNTNDLLSYLT